MTDASSGPGYHTHPEHRVGVEPYAGLVTVRAEGGSLVNSRHALVLEEQGYPPVYYIPIADVQMDRLELREDETYCPFKGRACYYGLKSGGPAIAWSYPQPYAEVAAIQGHLAFYPQRVDTLHALPDLHERPLP